MPRPKKVEEPTPVQEVVEQFQQIIEEAPAVPRPNMSDPEWHDWVMGQFNDDELDPSGKPFVDGLRRLVELILGDIVDSYALSVEGATSANQLRATVNYIVKVRWNNDPGDVRTFGGVADIYPGNTDDEYARYTAATAETRAEARALRKALRLKKTVAAEEVTSKPVTESGIAGYIVRSQERGIDKLCRDLDIDVLKFVNNGKSKYKEFNHIRYETAQKMLEELNKYLRDASLIPEHIVGYNADWRNES